MVSFHTFRLSRVTCIMLMLLFASSGFAASPKSIISMERANEILLSYHTPKYPLAARLRGMTGAGAFDVKVDPETGAVIDVSVFRSTGFAILDRSAVTAIKDWKFRPHKVVKVRIPVRFTL
jgi:protein TonB